MSPSSANAHKDNSPPTFPEHRLGTVKNADAIKNAGRKSFDSSLKLKLLFCLWSNYIGFDSSKAMSLMKIITTQKMTRYSEEMRKEISSIRGVRQDQKRDVSDSHIQLKISLNP